MWEQITALIIILLVVVVGRWVLHKLEWWLWWDHTKVVSGQFHDDYQLPSKWQKAWEEFKRW